MVISNGKGYLVFAIICGCSLIANLITNGISGSGEYWDKNRWVFGVSLLFSSYFSWRLWQHFEGQKKPQIDQKTGELLGIDESHTLFFINISWWGQILAISGVMVIIYDLTKQGG